MSRRKPATHPAAYGPGRYAPAPNGRGYDAVLCHAGRRLRARLPDEPSARAWIDAQAGATAAGRPPLTRAQLLDAADALAILPPGATLLDAARAHAAARATPAVPLADATSRFLADRAAGAVPLTVRGYRLALARLAAVAGDIPVCGLTPAHIAETAAHATGTTRNNLLRHLAIFFRWSIRHNLATADPCRDIPRARTPEPTRGILTLGHAEALLRAAQATRPEMLPYLVLGLFAGIRPAELLRLDPRRIGRDWITIDGHVAKTASHRTIPIRPNLRAWLDARPPGPRIAPLSRKHLYAAIRALRRQAGDVPWPDDCMRHSYASYGYDLTRDAGLIASEMGHRGTDIFFRHYRGLVQPGDGARYFAILPTPCQRPA